MKKTAGHLFDQYDQVIDQAKNLRRFYDALQMNPESHYKYAEKVGSSELKEALDAHERLRRVQCEIGPLAWLGIYEYDLSEQFDDGEQTPLTGERATKAKALWAIFMDWHPHIKYLSPLT